MIPLKYIVYYHQLFFYSILFSCYKYLLPFLLFHFNVYYLVFLTQFINATSLLVNPGAKERLVQITGPAEEKIK